MNFDAVVVLCTCPDTDKAKEIAGALLAEQLVACVNIIPGLTSLYHWDGQLCEDSEVQMLLKTPKHKLPQLEQAITRLHPYEVPEILALPIEWGHRPYLEWMKQNCPDDVA